MTIAVKEMFRGRRGDAYSSRERSYLVTGTNGDSDLDDHNALEAAVAFSPVSLLGTDGPLDRVNALISRHISNSQMEITVQYGEAGFGGVATRPIGSVDYEFSYQAPSVIVKQSLQTLGVFTEAGTWPPDTFFGAIGIDLNADGRTFTEPEGVTTAPGNTTDTWTYTTTEISDTYRSLVRSMMGGVNSQTFKGQPAGSMRFVSCTSQTASGKSTIRFGVQHQANRPAHSDETPFKIGNIQIPVEVAGHDYLWVHRWLKENQARKLILPAPKAVIIEQIFPRVDLNQLGF